MSGVPYYFLPLTFFAGAAISVAISIAWIARSLASIAESLKKIGGGR